MLTGQSALPFGGISAILIDDVAQLPPIGDKILYHNKPSGDLKQKVSVCTISLVEL